MSKNLFLTIIFTTTLCVLFADGLYVNDRVDSERRMHPTFNFKTKSKRVTREMPMLRFDPTKTEVEAHYWNEIAESVLDEQLASKSRLNTNVAKNVIMFMGDGMSIPTITAARVYIGGEEQQFTFEKFPYTGLSKTYCVNTQVADSACTATAYLGGVKANYATIGVSAAVELYDCLRQNDTAYHVTSLAEWAQRHGMATGLITTTAVTHASPAGVYAHAANRYWENDAEVLRDHGDPNVCIDIATQLVHGTVGRRLNVILGGGREQFLTTNAHGKRTDGKNLIAEWQQQHGTGAHYVQTRDELLRLPSTTERVLGLFADNHLPFHIDADAKVMPTLEEMVETALPILERQSNGKGYFLFVEGGRIDHAHHQTRAMKALDETAEFDKAIALAHARTNSAETLIVVTSDHSHTMSVAGYSSRKNDIFGIKDAQLADDQLPYATLGYANGPNFERNGDARRKNLHDLNMRDKNYQYPAPVPLESETHGGDDVGVFASGPFAHLFTGVYEQNFIARAIRYAACWGDKKTACTAALSGA